MIFLYEIDFVDTEYKNISIIIKLNWFYWKYETSNSLDWLEQLS